MVTAPESGSQLRAGSTVVLAGRATPGSPAAPVLAVTVNGRSVDALDAAGNFFALVQVASGVTALTVQATDALGQTATADVTLIGVEPSAGEFAFDQAHDTTAAGRLTFEGTFFNRQTQTLHAGMRLTNTGDDLLRAAVLGRVRLDLAARGHARSIRRPDAAGWRASSAGAPLPDVRRRLVRRCPRARSPAFRR
jgi:hypothetical protein